MKKIAVISICEVFVFMQNGATPLSIAAQYGHPETCRELIERGASIDLPQEVRTTLISSTVIYQKEWRAPLEKVLENARLKKFIYSFFSCFVARLSCGVSHENRSRNCNAFTNFPLHLRSKGNQEP